MSGAAPRIDARSARDIVRALVGTAEGRGLLEQLTSDPAYGFHAWKEYDARSFEPTGRSAALIGVFSRLAEIVIERINQVPDKSFLAFVAMLGAERRPPLPATAPITFTMAAGRAGNAFVPEGTQIAAAPAANEKEPVVFETTMPLEVTAAQLASVITVDPTSDRYGDWSARLVAPDALSVFEGERAQEHILYVGHAVLLGQTQVKRLSLNVTLANQQPAPLDARVVRWSFQNGADWQTLDPVEDTTGGLAVSGIIDFGAVAPVPTSDVFGRRSRWLRCELLTPIHRGSTVRPGRVRESHLPTIAGVQVHVELERKLEVGLAADSSFFNAAPLDLSKDFQPFGAQPKAGDTWFLASAEAFSKGGAAIESEPDEGIWLEVQLANPALGSVRPSLDLEVLWEAYDGARWTLLGVGRPPPWFFLLAVDSVPRLKTVGDATLATLQGWVPTGLQIKSSRLYPSPGEPRYLSVGVDGRFVDERSLQTGINVFAVQASYQGGVATTWIAASAASPSVELTVRGLPEQPVTSDQVEIRVKVSGANVAAVTTLRVCNGRDNTEQACPIADAAMVKLSEGCNPLLVEALSRDSTCLAVTTLVVSRTLAASTSKQAFYDGTYALCQSGLMKLPLPANAKTTVNGQENFWIRARIVRGDYGKPASYVLKDPLSPAEGFMLVPETFRPPSVAATRLGYRASLHEQVQPRLTYNQLTFSDRTAAATFVPFHSFSESQRPGMYLGFETPGGRGLNNAGLSLYCHVLESSTHASAGAPAAVRRSETISLPYIAPNLAWHYWNGVRWAQLNVHDATADFTRSGLLELVTPADFMVRELLGQTRHWLRVELAQGDYAAPPRLSRLLLNTTVARQATTFVREVLGSSTASARQRFRSSRTPVLDGQALEVREPEEPSVEDQARLRREEGADAIRRVLDASGATREIWVRWREVADFNASGPRDRHYVINHLSGEVEFGDGVSGLIPPLGNGNVRLGCYRSGGGKRGNRGIGEIAQLKSAVPYIEKAVNLLPSAGGAEAESTETLLERVPRSLRHRDRAVTIEDYEDLARLCSSEVARCRCVPLRDLAIDPSGDTVRLGHVSVIVVPNAREAKPLPSTALLELVRDFLVARAPATTRLSVVGPMYLRVNVTTEIALSAVGVASQIQAAVRAKLLAFLHPLTGGTDGAGWDFGRAPHRSDLFSQIEAVPGVDHVRFLVVRETDETAGSRRSGRFLVFSGEHQIDVF